MGIYYINPLSKVQINVSLNLVCSLIDYENLILPSPGNQGSISSTFYALIFLTKVHSKPNSKQKKAAQKIFVQKMRP